MLHLLMGLALPAAFAWLAASFGFGAVDLQQQPVCPVVMWDRMQTTVAHPHAGAAWPFEQEAPERPVLLPQRPSPRVGVKVPHELPPEPHARVPGDVCV